MDIKENDKARIDETVKKLFGNTKYKIADRLGGMTNRSYRVDCEDGLQYVVRLPGKGTALSQILTGRNISQNSLPPRFP